MRKQRQILVHALNGKKEDLNIRKDVLENEISNIREVSKDRNIDLSTYYLVLEIRRINFQLDNVAGMKKLISTSTPREIGEQVQPDDCIILDEKGEYSYYFLTRNPNYANLRYKIITTFSPVGKKLLNKKYGSTIKLHINGQKTEYLLLPT